MAVIGLLAVRRLRATRSWGPGSVLVGLSVVEQRYRAVLAVLAGESVTAVAAQIGVSRQSVHTWLARYRDERLAASLTGHTDRSADVVDAVRTVTHRLWTISTAVERVGLDTTLYRGALDLRRIDARDVNVDDILCE